jgi:hypothetical protein
MDTDAVVRLVKSDPAFDNNYQYQGIQGHRDKYYPAPPFERTPASQERVPLLLSGTASQS